MKYYYRKTLTGEKQCIARSYKCSDGINLDIGKRFDTIDPVSGIFKFFAEELIFCATEKELSCELRRLKKKYGHIWAEEI